MFGWVAVFSFLKEIFSKSEKTVSAQYQSNHNCYEVGTWG